MAKDDKGTAIQCRFDEPDFALIEDWRRAQPKIPALAETVRRLVKRGLDADRRAIKPKAENAAPEQINKVA